MTRTSRIAIVGGGMAGLAAATGFDDAEFDVELYERQSFESKRVNCGEAMTAVSKIPLEPTVENGFLNSLPAMEVEVYDSIDAGRRRTGAGTFPAANTYITDRNTVEQSWAEQLSEKGVDIHEKQSITRTDFHELTKEYDLVIDATGQPSLSSKALGTTNEYSGYMIALNSDVEGDFTELYPNSRIVLENYTGYSWAFPKTPQRANVGIGWTVSDRPSDYMKALREACKRNGWPVPSQQRTNVAIIPEGPSLDPDRTYLPEHSVVRVGDAAGIANRLTGKGISQAVESGFLAAELAKGNQLHRYPDKLYQRMKMEYIFATVVRYFLETRDPQILGAAIRAAAGIDIEDVDRSPSTVLPRLLRHPVLFARIFSRRRVLKRVYGGMTNQWELID
ncbi:digeranylgeranylglycerophospholipid reductase [Halopelagius inordinatus]|uniref:Digeranylgeranylglycerophospholipid reductase n=2 Tax=Halopelagius inordinatus TaxID=553467 RepID=A0A1I2W9J8_9EURY|nr:digeranylgeranylglycerophospholipid reductase [Halopelagius inordinatus]